MFEWLPYPLNVVAVVGAFVVIFVGPIVLVMGAELPWSWLAGLLLVCWVAWSFLAIAAGFGYT